MSEAKKYSSQLFIDPRNLDSYKEDWADIVADSTSRLIKNLGKATEHSTVDFTTLKVSLEYDSEDIFPVLILRAKVETVNE